MGQVRYVGTRSEIPLGLEIQALTQNFIFSKLPPARFKWPWSLKTWQEIHYFDAVWSLCTFLGLESLDIETGMGLQSFILKCFPIYVRFSRSGNETFLLVWCGGVLQVGHLGIATSAPPLMSLSSWAVLGSVTVQWELSGSRQMQGHGIMVSL